MVGTCDKFTGPLTTQIPGEMTLPFSHYGEGKHATSGLKRKKKPYLILCVK